MRRSLRLAVAAIAVAALTVGVGAPASAQEPLGFEVDKTQGLPGEVVNGQVDVADVAENCATDVAAFQAAFRELLSGPFAGGAAEGELFNRFFPGGAFDVENHDQLAYQATGFVVLGIAFDPAIAEEALPQSFVMTFADIATQEPVGERGNFDPNTGEGSVVVPDVEPGLWAVAATCVRPSLDLDTLETGIRANGAFLQEIGAPAAEGGVFSPEFVAFMQDFLDSDQTGFALLIEFLGEIGPDLLANVVEPDALGVQLFTVLTPQEALAAVAADIDALVADGALKNGYARGLTRHLDNATRSLDRGNTDAACDQLDGISDRSIPESILDAESAENLITQVEAVEAHLGCA